MITSSGDFCKYSVHIKAGLNCIPPSDDYSVSKKLAGKHLFCGMLQNSHFGHFMVESVSRLWASGFLKDIDSLVFYKREKRRGVPKFVEDFVALLTNEISITIVEEATEFETLFVPNQLGIERSGVFVHHNAAEPCVNNLIEAVRASLQGKNFPEKLYVSRSQLSGGKEALLEREKLKKP